MPENSSPAAIDHDIRIETAAAIRVIGKAGLQPDAAGHVVVRDREDASLFWVNPWGVRFADVAPDDLVAVDRDGTIQSEGRRAGGYQGQLAVLVEREDLNASVHTHATSLFTWASVGGTLSAITTESALLRGIQVFRPWDQPDTLDVLGEGHRIVIQHFHGAVTFGASLAEAAFYFQIAERSAQIELLARAAGRVELVPDEVAEKWSLTPELAATLFSEAIRAELTEDALLPAR